MSQSNRTEPVAVVGIGCRFPGGSNSPEAFWRLLIEGRDGIGPMPPGRFDVERFAAREMGEPGWIATRDGGFVDGIDRFDAAFFGLSPREARKIDPQHRLLLELAWEALEDGGIVPSSLAGSRTGVYVGLWTGEYENVIYRTPDELDFHSLTGGGRYAASGRISYALDLRGPCLTVDTGCSSALVALHLAASALASGEAELAMVGAANLILQPHVNIGYSRSGMLSPAARCRFGDAEAAGYVRSDGAGVVVLKALSRALADRDPIRGVVLATAVNADGRGSGQLATPSADAQAELLESVYRRAGVEPFSVAYVEAHGTGTRAGDPVELEALGRVLGQGRSEEHPLVVGSVKTNIGHTEAAAGMAGLVKTLLALEHRTIPASLHVDEPNPAISWDALRVEIPPRPRPWPAGAAPVAGVSSFGITGTNAHAVLAAAPAETVRDAPARADLPHVLALSAHTPGALAEQARNLRDALASRGEATPHLADLSYTTTCRREHLTHRLALVAESVEEAVQVLGEHLDGEGTPGLVSGDAEVHTAPAVGFVFSGQGSQWVGMGRELMRTAPVFAEAIAACERELDALVDWSLSEMLADSAELERVDVVQPVLAAVQIALARQLIAWGVRPAAVVGHSMGEVAAAHIAGALSLGDAMHVIALRSRLLAEIAGAGAMALVDLPEPKVRERLRAVGGRVSVAAINGPRSTVISGDPAAVDALLEALGGEEVFCRRVKVDVASHSAQTEPLLERLRRGLEGLEPQPAAVAFHSTVRVGAPTDARLDAEYWVENLRRPVRLAAAVEGMIAAGVEHFVEIAPHPILLSSLVDIAAEAGQRVQALGIGRREEPEYRRLLDALARLHVLGAPVAWDALAEEGARVVRLPNYPWQRERHWLEEWEEWSGGGDGQNPRVRWPDEARDWLYQVDWEERPIAPAAPTRTSGRWVVLGDGDDVGVALTRDLRGAGQNVVHLRAGETPETLRHLLTTSPTPIQGLVSLSALDANDAHPAEAALHLCNAVRCIVQEVVALAPEPGRALALVTRGAQRIAEDTATEASICGAPLWGFGRVARDEHPESNLRLIDLDPREEPQASAARLAAALLSSSTESDLALRDGRVWAPRLHRIAPPESISDRASWPITGATLITGGLGDLGLAVARHLAAQGVRRFVLLSRTPLPPRSSWRHHPEGTRTARQTRAILELEAIGASVHVAPVDVGDEAALGEFLARYEADAWPPIRAVVHTAGIIDSHLVRSLSPEALERVFRGKAAGAWNLHRAFEGVERFVLFSSTSVVIPQAGEANYAAANAFLDALGALRRARGLEAQVVNWGVWRDAGVIANEEGARYVAEVNRQGIGAMEPDVAVRIFDRIAASGAAQVMVAPVDWTRLRETRGAEHLGALCEHLEGFSDSAEPRERETSEMLGALAALPAPERRGAVEARVRQIVARILGIAPERVKMNATLGSQGMDSLMALELRNHVEGSFGLKASATLAWNYPTVPALAQHLLSRISERLSDTQPVQAASAAEIPERRAPAPVALSLQPHLEELDALSDEEVLRALQEGV